jgi:hypothetical protein
MKMMFSLLGAFAAMQVLTIWSAYRWYDIATSLFSLVEIIVLISLLVQLIRIKGHVLIRSTVGILVLCWVGFMIHVAWVCFTQVD